MRCEKCGYDCPRGESNCPVCGQLLPSEPRSTAPLSNAQPYAQYQYGNQSNGANRTCPQCGYANCQIITESSQKKGGYDSGTGFLGCVLLGPLGLLCGSCGNKQTVVKSLWYCPRCGNKFSL